jgi:hypothetical protein
MLNELVRVVHSANSSGHDHTPALTEEVVDVIDLKTGHGLGLEFVRGFHSRVEKDRVVREAVVDRKRHRAAGGGGDDPADTTGSEMLTTLCLSQWLKNRTRQRACAPLCSVHVTTEQGHHRDLKRASDRAESGSAQLHVGLPLKELKEPGVDARLACQILLGQPKLLAASRDSTSQVSGLGLGCGFHTASVRF